MKGVLVVHPQFEVIGGAELVSARIMEWFLENARMEVTLMTLLPVKISALVLAGMSESAARRVNFRLANCPKYIMKSHAKFELLKLAFLHRGARQICGDYDLCMSSYNELDFRRMGIQYIHHPSFADRSLLRELDILGSLSVLDAVPGANFLYRHLVSAISGDRIDGFKRNITLVNSYFMNYVLDRAYGMTGRVVYPAFLEGGTHSMEVEWDRRDLRFVSVGRIARDKKLLLLIDYFALLHNEFPTGEFVIAGRSSDLEYERLVVEKANRFELPLRILRDLTDQELKSILAASKFYVHPKINEHFGIAVLEAAASGCLTMVHNSGAGKEIVGSPLLLFNDGGDLLTKVKRLYEDNVLRSQVQAVLRSNLAKFTLEEFYSRLGEIFLPLINSIKKDV